MMCPACLGHGKFRDETRCEVCNGTGSVTMRQGDKFLSGKVEAKTGAGEVAASPAPAKGPGRNAKKGSASRAAKARARKAHAQTTRKVAQAASGKGAAE